MNIKEGASPNPKSNSRPASSMSAKSRVEEFLHTESRLSQIDKPEPYEGETKSKYGWRLIRHCVRHAINLMEKANIQEMMIGHGIHHNRRLNHPNTVTGMIFNKNEKEYYTIDGLMVRIFKADGRRRDIVSLEAPVDQLIYAAQLNLFVGWQKDQDHLMLMTEVMEATSTSHAPAPITAAVYNANVGEVVTVGGGYVVSWVFRYGGRHLLPRKTIQEGVDPKECFSMLVLEETASHSQRAYAASANAVMVVNLYEGQVLSVQRNLHVRTITAITFFNPLKYLITGAKDGSIKVWDETWHLQLVFVGHGAGVSALNVYPYGPLIMSASHDNTMRVWSMETCDEVDVVPTSATVLQIGVLINCDNLFTASENHVDLWTVKHIHTLHTTIGHKVQHIKSTDHPHHPVRSLLMCQDSSIRVISPPSGEVITSLLMDPCRKIVDAAYAIAEDLLFIMLSDGTLVRASTKTNPCKILNKWRCREKTKACNCLLVYEYVIMAKTSDSKALNSPQPVTRRHHANRTLLLGGRKDGSICVYDWETGKVDFDIEAHGAKGVLSMIANSRNDQVISSGLDNIIKVWRLYPYAHESLAPLMSFYCGHTPVYMTVMREKLSVAFEEPTSATYSIVMYNLKERNRSDHGPGEDHMDNITGMTACPKMKITASTSTDGTLRIWNENNDLIRLFPNSVNFLWIINPAMLRSIERGYWIYQAFFRCSPLANFYFPLCRLIKLNAIPHSLAFCSNRGDLLLGVGDHLHKIAYRKYMPKAYCFKMVSMQFFHEEAEKALPFDENLLNKMVREDVKRLKAARSSFKFTHFIDVLTEAENEEVMREKKLKEKVFNQLANRETELVKIRDGELTAGHKPKKTATTKREAFNKYLKIFYSRPELDLYPDEPFLEDRVRKQMKGNQVDEVKEDKWKPEVEPVGFFPPSSESRQTTDDDFQIPIKTDGFVPNSVLVRLLWPQEAIEERSKKEEYRPPQLTEEQLAHINNKSEIVGSTTPRGTSASYSSSVSSSFSRPASMKSRNVGKKKTINREESSFRNTTLYLDYGEDEDQKSVSEEEETKEEVEKEPESAFLQKMQAMMAKAPSPEPPEEEPEPQIPVVEYLPAAEPRPQRQQRLSRPVNKLVSKLPTPKPPLVRIPAPTSTSPHIPSSRNRSPTPSPPPTPLPEFISQFIGQGWFDHYFPNCNSTTMPKPWTVAGFVTMLARLIRIAEYNYKVEVIKALRLIRQNHGLPGSEVPNALMSVFHHRSNPPTCLDPDQRNFIQEALQMLQVLHQHDLDFYVELLVAIMDGDKDIRQMAFDFLKSFGLRDPHGLFTKELDGWDVWSLGEQERPAEIRKMCRDWLDRWFSSFKLHLQDTIDRLKKGQNIHGRVASSQLSGSANPRSILKKGESSGDEPGSSAAGRSITVSFDQAPDASAIENATYIDAINYFCDMEMEKNFRQRRDGSRKRKPDQHKNTILVLPQLPSEHCLVRLGDTHTSKCRPHRETALSVGDLKLPPVTTRGQQPAPGQLYGFPSCINLPMKTVYMNPFPSPLDEIELMNTTPVLLTLKSAQKYFVPARSYLPQDTC